MILFYFKLFCCYDLYISSVYVGNTKNCLKGKVGSFFYRMFFLFLHCLLLVFWVWLNQISLHYQTSKSPSLKSGCTGEFNRWSTQCSALMLHQAKGHKGCRDSSFQWIHLLWHCQQQPPQVSSRTVRFQEQFEQKWKCQLAERKHILHDLHSVMFCFHLK